MFVYYLQGRTPLHLAIGMYQSDGHTATLADLDKSVLDMLFERGLNVSAVDNQVSGCWTKCRPAAWRSNDVFRLIDTKALLSIAAWMWSDLSFVH